MAGYTGQYTAEDVATATIDVGVKSIIGAGAFAGLIGAVIGAALVVVAVRWGMGKK